MPDNLPAYLLGPRRQVGQDSVQGMGMPPLPSISIADNLFTLIDAAGAKLPVPTMGIIDPSAPNSPHGPYLDAILIDANKIMSKAYYPDAWRRSEDGGYKPPECWSDNGVGPSVNATKPFAKLCNTCPNDRWGSAINAQGNEVKACHDVRKMAWIIPDLWRAGTQTVFLLRMKGGSFKNWRTYHDSIIRNRVGDRAMDPTDLVTRIYFESQGVLKFRAVQLIDEDMAQAQDRIWREKVTDRLLGKGDVPISELPSSDRQDRQALPSQAEINTGHPPPPPPSSAQWDRGWQTPAAPQQGFLPQSAPSPATNTQEPPQRRRRGRPARSETPAQVPQGVPQAQPGAPPTAPWAQPPAPPASPPPPPPAGNAYGMRTPSPPTPDVHDAIAKSLGIVPPPR